MKKSSKMLHHTMNRQSSHKKMSARNKSDKKHKLGKKRKRPGKNKKRPGKRRRPENRRRMPSFGNSVRAGLSRNAIRHGKSSIPDAHLNRLPQVHCSKSSDGSSGTFMCHHKGRLPPSMLNAIQDDSYIIVTGAKSGRQKLVIIQREGRALTRDILLNILESNDIVRKANKSMKPNSKKSGSKSFRMKSRKSLNNAGANKSKRIKGQHKHTKFGKKRPQMHRNASGINAMRMGKKKHKFRKKSKFSNESRLLSRASNKKTLHPSPKKTVTLEIKLEVNEKPTAKRGHGTSKSAVTNRKGYAHRKGTKVVSKENAKVPSQLNSFDLKPIEAKQNLSGIEYMKNYRTKKYKSKIRVRRSHHGSQLQDGNTGIEAFLGPTSITFGSPSTKFNLKNAEKILRTGKRKPNFKLDFVSEDNLTEKGSHSKQPGINAQVSFTNKDLQQLFDSLDHRENDLVSMKNHQTTGNNKPVITVSIHIGSLFPTEHETTASVDSQQLRIKPKTRSRLRLNGIPRKQADKHLLNTFKKVAGKVSKDNDLQTAAIIELLPNNFNGQMSEIELQDVLKNIKSKNQKPSFAVKILFLLYLTTKMSTNDSNILLHNGGHLPSNIRQELEDANILPSLNSHIVPNQLVQNTNEDRLVMHSSQHGKHPLKVKTTNKLHTNQVGFGSNSWKNASRKSKNQNANRKSKKHNASRKSKNHTEISKFIEEKAGQSSRVLESAKKPVWRKGKNKMEFINKNRTYEEVDEKAHKASRKDGKTLGFGGQNKTYHEAVGPGHKSRVSSKMLSKGFRKDNKKYGYRGEKKTYYEGHKSIFSESSKKPNKGFRKDSFSFSGKKKSHHKGDKAPSSAPGEKHTQLAGVSMTGHQEGNLRKPTIKGSTLYNETHLKGKLFSGKQQKQIVKYDEFKVKELKAPEEEQDERFHLSSKGNKNHMTSSKRLELLLNEHIDKGKHGKDYNMHRKKKTKNYGHVSKPNGWKSSRSKSTVSKQLSDNRKTLVMGKNHLSELEGSTLLDSKYDQGPTYMSKKKMIQARRQHAEKAKASKFRNNKLPYRLETVSKNKVNKSENKYDRHFKPLSKSKVLGSSHVSKNSKLSHRKRINNVKPFVKIADTSIGGSKPKTPKTVLSKSKQHTISKLSPKKLIETNRASMSKRPYKEFNEEQLKEGPRKLASHKKFTHVGKVELRKSTKPKTSRGKVAVTKSMGLTGDEYRSKPKVLKWPAAARGKFTGSKNSDHKLNVKTLEGKHFKTISSHKEYQVQPKSKLRKSHEGSSMKTDSEARQTFLTVGKVANLATGAVKAHNMMKGKENPALTKSPLHLQEQKHTIKTNKVPADGQDISSRLSVNEGTTEHKASKLDSQSVGKMQKEQNWPTLTNKAAFKSKTQEMRNSNSNLAVKSKSAIKNQAYFDDKESSSKANVTRVVVVSPNINSRMASNSLHAISVMPFNSREEKLLTSTKNQHVGLKSSLSDLSNPVSKEHKMSKMELKKEAHGNFTKDNSRVDEMHRKQHQGLELLASDNKLPTIQGRIKSEDVELKDHVKTSSSLAARQNSERHKSQIPISKLEGRKELHKLKVEDTVPNIEQNKLKPVDTGSLALPSSKTGDERKIKMTGQLLKLEEKKEFKLRKKDEHLPDVEKKINSDHIEMKEHMKSPSVPDLSVKASKNFDESISKDSHSLSNFDGKKEVHLQKNEDKVKELERSDSMILAKTKSSPDSSAVSGKTIYEAKPLDRKENLKSGYFPDPSARKDSESPPHKSKITESVSASDRKLKESVKWNEPAIINAAKLHLVEAKIKLPHSIEPVKLSASAAEHALVPVADIQKTKVLTKKAGKTSPLLIVDSDRLLRDTGLLHAADSNMQVFDSKTSKLSGYQRQQLHNDRGATQKQVSKMQTEILLNGTGKSRKKPIKLTLGSKVPTKKVMAVNSSVKGLSSVSAVKTKLPPRMLGNNKLSSSVGFVVEQPVKQFRTSITSQPVASSIASSYLHSKIYQDVLNAQKSIAPKPQLKTLMLPTEPRRPELIQSNSQVVKIPMSKVANASMSNGLNPVKNTATVVSEKQTIQAYNISQQLMQVVSKNGQCVVANPCRNFGTCQTSAGGVVVCVCRQGFGGPTCETAVNPCRPSPCLNDANCTVTLTSVSTQDSNGLLSDKDDIDFLCSCLSGFTGRRCEIRLNPCDAKPCLHGGRCSVIDVSNVTGALFRCECVKTFVGSLCEITLEPTLSSSSSSTRSPRSGCSTLGREECQNGGTCRPSSSSEGHQSHCHCQLGFIGKRCEIRAVQCTNQFSCFNGGTCLQDPGGDGVSPYFRCLCLPQFAGRLCVEVRRRPVLGCDLNPCSLKDASATCREVADRGTGQRGFSCTCSPGRSGELCEIGGDPCGLRDAKRNNPCRNSGICLPLPGDGLYRCLCTSHYVGRHCDIAVVRCGTTVCLNGGACSSTDHSSSIGDHGRDVVTIMCRCPVGYVGRHCERHTDPCRISPCINSGLCRPADNHDGFSCICAEPFFGWHCELTTNGSSSASDDVDESGQESPDQVSPKTETLIVDMRGDGDCGTEVYCLNGGSCFRTTAGRRVCVCQRGFGGERCENSRDSCSSFPCLNGATCYNSPSATFRCVCPTGYTGSRCDVGPTICAGNAPPCQNNGACRPARNTAGYECICPLGYGGLACELRDPCLDRPCRNGAECFVLPATDLIPSFAGSSLAAMSSFQCRCPAGFSGQYCEVDGTSRLESSERTACSSVPCQGGATCRLSSSRDSFVCVCPPGVKGKMCERDSRNDCRRAPCRHGGICFDRPGGFECSCPDGYRGITCEVKLFGDPCDSHPCSNGGRCKVGKPYNILYVKHDYCTPSFEQLAILHLVRSMFHLGV